MAQGWDALESTLGLFAVKRVAGLVAVHAAGPRDFVLNLFANIPIDPGPATTLCEEL
jgi:hypothetical protein